MSDIERGIDDMKRFLNGIDPSTSDKFAKTLGKQGQANRSAAESNGKFNRLLSESSAGYDEFDSRMAKAKDSVKKYGEKLLATTSQVGRSLMASNEGFSSLNPIVDLAVGTLGKLASAGLSLIPIVGKGMGKAAEAAAETVADITKLMIEQYGNVMSAYKKISDTGVATGMSNLRDLAGSMGLKFGDAAEVLGKQGTTLGLSFGSAYKGAKVMAGIGGIMKANGTVESLMQLGFSQKEIMEASGSIMNQEILMGSKKSKDAGRLAETTNQYLREMDGLAKLTGINRKQQTDIREQALNETVFLSSIQAMKPENVEQIQQFNIQLRSLTGGNDNPLAQGMRDLVSGSIKSEAAIKLVAQTGGDANKIIDDLKAGRITASLAMEKMSETYKKNLATNRQVGQANGDTALLGDDFALQTKLANGDFKNREEAEAMAKASSQAVAEGADKMTKNLTGTQLQMYEAGRKLELTATNSKLVQQSMTVMSDALDAIAEQMYKMTGREMPEYLKDKKKERAALENYQKVGKDKEKAVHIAIESARQLAMTSGQSLSGEEEAKIEAEVRKNYDKKETAAKKEWEELKKKREVAESEQRPDIYGGKSDVSAGKSDRSPEPPNGAVVSAGDVPIKNIVESGPGWIVLEQTDGKKVKRVGTANWRMNNPGNIRYGGFAKQLGAIGEGDAGPSGKFAVFPSMGHGLKAKEELLFGAKSRYASMTIWDAMHRYAPASDNNPAQYAQMIATNAGVDVRTTLTQLTAGQRQSMLDSINKHEGFKVGKTFSAKDGVIADGPASGFSGIAHGNEATIPLGGDVSTRSLDLNVVMSELIKNSESKVLNSLPAAGAEIDYSLINDNVRGIISKMDEFIAHMEKDRSLNEEQLAHDKA